MARAIDATELQRKMCALCNQDYYDEPCDPRDCVFSRAINDAPTLTPQWISVEERLPEKNGTYLVYAPTYSGGSSSALDCVGGVMFSRFKNKKWSIEAGYYKRPNCVTHWMPMPEPPNGKEAPHE